MNAVTLRNDVSKLVEAGIPVELGAFDCGYWGKHQPPHVQDDKIVIEVGKGYESYKHTHGQNAYVLEVDAGESVALIEMRKYGDLYGSGLWHYLVGVDGAPFVAQIKSTIDTLAEALESLKPAAVKRAEEAGTEIIRQGDWWFVPVKRTPRGEVSNDFSLDSGRTPDHIAEKAIALKTKTYVSGRVVHRQHNEISLAGWYEAIQNTAIRTGRLARGGGVD